MVSPHRATPSEGLEVLDLLLMALLVGLSSAGLTIVVRHAPFIRGWVERGIKPWACDVCMTFWGVLIFTAALQLKEPQALWVWFVSYTIGKYSLRKLTDPEGVPPGLIPSDSEDP